MSDQKNPFASPALTQETQPVQTQPVQTQPVIEGNSATPAAGVNQAPLVQTASQDQAPPKVEYGGDVMDVTFEDDIKLNVVEKFPTLSKNETARLAFVLFDANGAPKIKFSNYMYDDISRKTILAPRNPEVLAQVTKKLGDPKVRFGTVVAKYRTDEYGNLYNSNVLEVQLYALIFSTDKFPSFKNLHKEWGLSNHDIIIQCKEEKYQNWTINVARESIIAQNFPQNAPSLIQKATEIYDKYIDKFMGRKYEDEELLALLGISGSGLPSAQNINNPFQQQAAATPETAAQVGNQGAKEDFSHLVDQNTPNKG